jgi:thiosulfate reductase cytochrome b subunit
MSKDLYRVKRAVAWLLLLVSLAFLLTGFGITQYRIVEPLTLGVLGKALSFRLHELLWVPFVILLIIHVAMALAGRARRR